MAELVCQWCRQSVTNPAWWDGRPQCLDPHQCERRRQAAKEAEQ